ncbi:MAG: phosphonate metabolism protein/1,5-bisphosphokinase (PRPP-forming) PhnN [Rhizobiaceae bacterium]|nr:phosphonate metabolism protein/1,5-bisphosphokinase (PRPP-forming) PhnN [Rhizobiaceae bacterium]MCV0405961.1 phosphonate metabolism protein/1,5-bisphosphokinase (PRPP-forming) PhnN [Rhizobiaceae bacterium]
MNALAAEAPVSRPPLPIAGGVFIGVCGPSGAGKDSVIGYARERLDGLAGIAWARRVVTRPADAGAEDHDTMDEAAFAAAEAKGAFALTWRAHGLAYGLPASLDRAVSQGKVAVANISRAAAPALRARYADCRIVVIDARAEVLAGRLAARGRETRDEILKRLARRPAVSGELADATNIDNSGRLDIAGERFVETVLAALQRD